MMIAVLNRRRSETRNSIPLGAAHRFFFQPFLRHHLHHLLLALLRALRTDSYLHRALSTRLPTLRIPFSSRSLLQIFLIQIPFVYYHRGQFLPLLVLILPLRLLSCRTPPLFRTIFCDHSSSRTRSYYHYLCYFSSRASS